MPGELLGPFGDKRIVRDDFEIPKPEETRSIGQGLKDALYPLDRIYGAAYLAVKLPFRAVRAVAVRLRHYHS